MTFAVLRFAGKAPVKSERLKFSTSLTEISFFKSFLISPVGFLNLKKNMLQISYLVSADVKKVFELLCF